MAVRHTQKQWIYGVSMMIVGVGYSSTCAWAETASNLSLRSRISLNELSASSQAITEAVKSRKVFAKKELLKSEFRNENLRNADFSFSVLTDSVFDGAVAENANFSNAVIHGVSFRGANLRGANLSNVETSAGKKTIWVGANLTDANLSEIQLVLVGCPNYYSIQVLELASPRIMSSILDTNNGDLSLRGATLTNATICGDLTGVDLRSADLRGADLTNTTNAHKALLNRARYDSRTKIPVEPKQHRMQQEPIGPMAARLFTGEWLIDIDRGPSESSQRPGLLFLGNDRNYEWTPSNAAAMISGKWQLGPDSALLLSGEDGVDWELTLSKTESQEPLLRLKTARGDKTGIGIRRASEGPK